jgi:hypothetical protein
MARYIGLHTMPGFSREMLAGATPQLEKLTAPHFVRAYTSFSEGKVVCEWESADKPTVAAAYAELGFPFDEIVLVEAICDNGDAGVDTRYT